MSETVSFRCSGQLVEFLEQEAERRMTTKSQVAQTLLAEKVREMQGEDAGNEASTREDGEEETGPLEEPPFTDHPRAWYEPKTQDPDHLVGVRIPDGDGYPNQDRRYYKTYDGAAKAIKRWYE